MANTKHGLQETIGIFQVRGIITGMEKDNFYEEKKTKTNKDMRMVNFGLEFAPNKTVYLSLNGITRDDVYFSKRGEDGKTVVEKVKWSARKTFNKEGYNLIGVRLGLTKDEKGKNIQEILTEYDACEKIGQTLKDGVSVYSQGRIEFSSFDGKDGKKRSIKFIPQQISLCTKEVDFEDEEFAPKADFNQQIIFMGIEKKDEVFVVSAKIVTYSSIEDAEFIIKDEKLANMFRKNLKPYNAIQVYGHISVEETIEEVEDDDTWGEADPTKKIVKPTRRELVITGAKGSSVDTTTYTKEIIEEAIAKLEQDNRVEQDWGSSNTTTDLDEDEDW